MYLEQRIEQLENVTVEHGKQIEMIAAGLATLTTTVNNGFSEMRAEFRLVKSDITELKTDVAGLKTDVAQLKTDVAELKTDVAQLKTEVIEIKGRLDRLTIGVESLVELIKTRII
jgi:chromosome segregation ATPase